MSFKDIMNYQLFPVNHVPFTVENAVFIIFTVILTFAGLKIVRRIFNRFIIKHEAHRGSYWSVYLIIQYVTWVIVIVLLLDSANVKVSVLLASFAALLVGVGFGIQQLFSDLASGIVLLFERNLQLNEIIQLEDGTVGKVIDIGLRTSKLKTRDDVILIVPNSKFVNNKIINWSHIDYKTRFHVDVGVAYGSDVQLVTSVLLGCAKVHPGITHDPKPFVRFDNFGNSSLDFQLFFWVIDSFRVENTKSELRYAIDAEFRKNNIKIPFPQRDVYLKNQ